MLLPHPGASRARNLQAQIALVIVQGGFARVSIWQLSTYNSIHAEDLFFPITRNRSVGDVGRTTLSLVMG